MCKRKRASIKLITCVSILFLCPIIVYANSGNFTSIYHITPGIAGYGLLDSRTFNLATNNRTVTVALTPTQAGTGNLTGSLRRQGPLGGWSMVRGSEMTFLRTSASTRSANGGNSGTHRVRIVTRGAFDRPAAGGIRVSW